MKEVYKDKTKEQLLNDLVGLRQRIAELEKAKIECKREELEIRNLQRYNRGLIEASLDPLVTFDQRGTILDVNEATVQATGRTREELIGTPLPDYFTDHEKAHKGVLKVFEIGEVQDCELVMKAQDRTETVVVYNASVYKDQAGQVAGAFAAARDITERKQAEEVVKKSRKFLDTIIENIPDPIYIKDRQFRFVGVNKAFCRTHKVTKGKGEILGKPRYRETDEEIFKTGKELEIPEQHYTDAEGNQHWTHLKKCL